MTGPRTPDLTRRALLGGAFASLAGAALAEAPLRSLRPVARPDAGAPLSPLARTPVAEIIREARLGGPVGFAVADAATGEILESGAADTPLPPASVAKALTALYALQALGPYHRFETRLIATGPVTEGVLEGDLVLAGGGDPGLTTDDLGDLAAALAATGLREVRGRFLVWGGALPYQYQIDPDQQAHVGYNPAVSGLNLNYNRVHFQWTREAGKYAVKLDARAERFSPDVTAARLRIVDRRLPVYTHALDGGVDEWTVARAALGEAGARWLPVRRPELYAGDVFATLARSEGIPLGRPQAVSVLPPGRTLAAHRSPPLTDLLRDMLRWSTNLTAEAVGLAATAARGIGAATLAQSGQAMSDWARARLGARFDLVDHSGLGDASRVTAAGLATALVAAGRDGRLRPLLREIALVDEARAALDDPPGAVVAKTGTLNFVSALAGYLNSDGGADMAFAILTAAPEARSAAKLSQDEVPEGARPWAARSRRLQQRLLQRWAVSYPA